MGHHPTSGVLEDSGAATAFPTCPLSPTREWDIQEVPHPQIQLVRRERQMVTHRDPLSSPDERGKLTSGDTSQGAGEG